jgi:predicted MFS family arabinose efflux permease
MNSVPKNPQVQLHQTSPVAPTEHGAAQAGNAYPWYVLTVLTLIYGVQTLDRQIVAVLLEPIRHEFRLSDSQLGMLSSLSFATAYALTCVPLGMLADRIARKHLLCGVLLVWSGFTALSSLAQSYVHLLLARIMVGGAEAGNNPAALSMLADYFGPRNRATATSLYFLGQSLGVFGGFLIGGMIAAAYGWRAAFLMAGLPGMLLVLVVWLTVREPRRGAQERTSKAAEQTAALGEVLRCLWSTPSARRLVLGNIVNSFMAAGFVTWAASFLIRSHGLDARSAGVALGLGLGAAITVGSVAGGLISDRVGRYGVRARTRAIAVFVIASVPMYAGSLVAPDATAAMALLSLATVFNATQYGPLYALLQSLMRPRMRSSALSVVFFLNNLIGYGAGPLAVGLLSDVLTASRGADSLRTALALVMSLQVLAAVLFLRAGATAEHDVEHATQASA